MKSQKHAISFLGNILSHPLSLFLHFQAEKIAPNQELYTQVETLFNKTQEVSYIKYRDSH